MSWEAVIGLEIHVQLATQSKIFLGLQLPMAPSPTLRRAR